MFGRVFFNIYLLLKCVTNSHIFFFTNQPSWGKHYKTIYTYIYIALFATKDVFLGSIETSPPGGREEWLGVACRLSSMY